MSLTCSKKPLKCNGINKTNVTVILWKHHKAVLGAFVFPQRIFDFSPNRYLLSLALQYGNTSLAEKKSEQAPHYLSRLRPSSVFMHIVHSENETS